MDKEIVKLALEISEVLKKNANPHTKIEITINKIEQTSVDWSESTPEWN
ncbi:hypothetical protein IGJ91_001638 [Enterococcus sp. DIV0765f]|nr:hypothetical protein [Enterococcus mundtii]UBM04691.1 hypothetical protein K9N66_09285 [Enterococcus mundtii]GKS53451.1 hypothetical protein EMLAB_00660 [Enterococcus mundtii]